MESNNLTQKEAIDMLAQMNVLVVPQNLIFYSQEGDFNKVELLLKAGVNPNSSWKNEKQKKNIFALTNTAGYGKTGMVKLLLENGADINLQDENGETALMYAIQTGNKETIKLLIDNGADLNIMNKAKVNALFLAEKKKDPEIIELLKNAGAIEMTVEEIKAHKKAKLTKTLTMVIAFALCVGIVQLCNSHSSSGSSSSSSSSSEEHTCTWCNKSYSGNGYHHIGNRCETARNGWEKQNQNCSMKCCEEAWKNGRH